MRWTEQEYQTYLARQHRPPTAATTAAAAAALPEVALLAQVHGLARHHGWLCYHTHDSRKSDEGFPALVLVSPQRIIFAELKTRTGTLTALQAVWLELLRHTGKAEVYCWRPADWPQIVACLTGSGCGILTTTEM